MIIGEFLFQQRSMNKKTNPGKWSVTGGAVDPGEKSIDAVYRECKEELGVDLNPDKVEFMMSVKAKGSFVDIYLDRENIDEKKLNLLEEEVNDVKWFNKEEISQLIKESKTTKSVVRYFNFLCNLMDENDIL